MELTADEISHVNKVRDVGKASCAPFGQLYLLVETFKDTVVDTRAGEVGDDPRPMTFEHGHELLHVGERGLHDGITPFCEIGDRLLGRLRK